MGRLIYKRWALCTPLFASDFNFGLAAAQALNAALLQQQAQAGIPQAHVSIAEAQPKFAQSCSLAKGETRSLSQRTHGGRFLEVAKSRACVEEAAQSPCPGWRGDVTGLASGTPQPPAHSLAGARGCPKPAHVPRDINTERDGALGAR